MTAKGVGAASATGGDGKLEVRLLGTFDVRVDGRPLPPLRSRKEQWLLALLTLRHDREVARDWLAATFWPDNEESQARFYLRKALSNLRAALGPAAAHRLVSPTTLTVRLDLSGAFADTLVFDAAVARPLSEGEPEAGLIEALALYRGPLLQDCLEEREWLAVEREARAQSYLAALEAVAGRALARGEAADATRWLRRAVAADPYRESAAGSLMRALAQSGDRAAVRQVYQELRARLREDLDTTPAPETDALYRRLSDAPVAPEAAPPPAASAPAALAPSVPPAPSRRHLPVPLTDLIGRGSEVDEVGLALTRSRLVTLLGAGGVGKTRLAIAAAEAALPRFPDGAWFVDLAPLTDGDFVAQTAARALGVPQEAERTAEECLTAALAPRTLLLVLDNCEHLLDASATLAGRLLSACPGLRILSTSRQALGVTGEQVYSVPSLALPPSGDAGGAFGSLQFEKNPAFLTEYAAVELFVQRAAQANPAFRLDRRTAESVCRICLHLDGIPLALELAAARLRSLSVGQIEARLSDRFRLLTTGSRAALPRQQTLRALVDWSYDLLSGGEQTLLRRLSVFAGGWTLEAAEEVCAGGDLEAGQVLDALSALVEKSLAVHAAPGQEGGEARYRLLETIRQYGHDRLAEAGEVAACRRRYCDHFLALAEDIQPKLNGPEQGPLLDRLQAEYDNLRHVLVLCEEDAAGEEGAQNGLRLVTALSGYWLRQDLLAEARRHSDVFLARKANAAPTSRRADALVAAGNLAYCLNDNPAARDHFEEARAIRQRLGDRRGLAGTLGSLGNVAHVEGDYAAARGFFDEALALSRETGSLAWQSVSLTCLGAVTFDQGDYAASRAYTEAALETCRRAGDRETESIVLNTLGLTAQRQSLLADALDFYAQALALARLLGIPRQEAITLANMANVTADLGDVAAAGSLYGQALSLKRDGGDVRTLAPILESVADFLTARGRDHLIPACRLWGAAEQLREEGGCPCSPAEQEAWEGVMATVRRSLAPETIDAARAEGRAMTFDQVIAYALRETESVQRSATAAAP